MERLDSMCLEVLSQSDIQVFPSSEEYRFKRTEARYVGNMALWWCPRAGTPAA